MATKTIKGKDLLLKVGNVAVGCASTVSFTSSFEMIETSCRELAGFYDAEAGDFKATLSSDGIMRVDTPADATKSRFYDLALLHMNQTKIAFVFGTAVTGEHEWYGNAYINSYEQSAAQKEAGTYSVSFEVVGAYGIRPKPL